MMELSCQMISNLQNKTNPQCFFKKQWIRVVLRPKDLKKSRLGWGKWTEGGSYRAPVDKSSSDKFRLMGRSYENSRTREEPQIQKVWKYLAGLLVVLLLEHVWKCNKGTQLKALEQMIKNVWHVNSINQEENWQIQIQVRW